MNKIGRSHSIKKPCTSRWFRQTRAIPWTPQAHIIRWARQVRLISWRGQALLIRQARQNHFVRCIWQTHLSDGQDKLLFFGTSVRETHLVRWIWYNLSWSVAWLQTRSLIHRKFICLAGLLLLYSSTPPLSHCISAHLACITMCDRLYSDKYWYKSKRDSLVPLIAQDSVSNITHDYFIHMVL